MIGLIQMKKGNLTHERVLEIEYEDETFTFKATNGRDRFPEELIEELVRIASEMQDHNELMEIRDLERK